jgi:hypothetical protein
MNNGDRVPSRGRRRKKQHASPCAQCPFRRASLPGYLGGTHPDVFGHLADSDVRMPCHLHLPDGVNYAAAVEPGSPEYAAPQCAGRAIHWRNQLKTPRDPQLLVLPADHARVFTWPSEFVLHHRERALAFWQTLSRDADT